MDNSQGKPIRREIRGQNRRLCIIEESPSVPDDEQTWCVIALRDSSASGDVVGYKPWREIEVCGGGRVQDLAVRYAICGLGRQQPARTHAYDILPYPLQHVTTALKDSSQATPAIRDDRGGWMNSPSLVAVLSGGCDSQTSNHPNKSASQPTISFTRGSIAAFGEMHSRVFQSGDVRREQVKREHDHGGVGIGNHSPFQELVPGASLGITLQAV
ncbi:hypothetical protein FHL15_011030 [Xylaria flabelliformis]|uniref:Uncharacterized protein n=1 Tax=Xylaria flabelliformis TaxID=2512241 RepID=A0A553HJE1_9PEZI|nr:hypothetical protein FHL15_011030 [Xylaria flabelliformis]